MEEYFLWYKTIHVISVISWMSAIFYMPRLFAYHTRAEIGSEMDKTFQTMESRLLRIIMRPAMISTYIFGTLTAYVYGLAALGVWFHIKIFAVICITILHGLFAKWVTIFREGKNNKSERFYKSINEIPVILMIISVIMVIIKPFE